jgi:pyridoxamine 5'-phosphate oxidase
VLVVSLPWMRDRELRETDVDPDPIVEMSSWIAEAQEAGIADWDSMVVATADAGGAPSARFVLLRGVDAHGFRFYTNYESEKGRDLDANPRAALVLHWHELGRQIRVTGSVTRLTPEESVEYWRNRPRPSRLSAWASQQSEPVASRAELEAAVADIEKRFPDDDVPLPPFWGGYLVAPDEIELWQHRDDRLHDRLRYRRAGRGWIVERLQP